MAPVTSNQFNVIVRNRSKEVWQWDGRSDQEQKEGKKTAFLQEILVNGICTIKCESNEDNKVRAKLSILSQKSKGKEQKREGAQSVNIILNPFASSSGSWNCFGWGRGKSNSSSTWIEYTETRIDQIKLLYRQTKENQFEVLIIQTVDPSSFLSLLPDQACLSTLCIPGTHESLARYGWPISTCQATESTVINQLQDGIRYLDIRLVPKGEPGQIRLLAYHGITDERIEFGSVLQQCWQFLESQSGNRETIIMSIKQESGDQDTFIRTLFETYVNQTPASPSGKLAGVDRWFLEDRIPNLGEVRGKIVMLSRFVIDSSYGFPGGISPPIWPNSFKGIFNYTLSSGQNVITQDWYDIGSLSQLDAKFGLIQELSTTSINYDEKGTQNQTLALNYTNGSSFPFALPPAVANGSLTGTSNDGINSRVRDFVADIHFKSKINSQPLSGALSGLQITWALDFYNNSQGAQDLVPLLIAANF